MAVEYTSQKVFKAKTTSVTKGLYFIDYKGGYPVSNHYTL